MSLDHPRLRPVKAFRVHHQGRWLVGLEDPWGVVAQPYFVTQEWFEQVIRHFDGRTSLAEIQGRLLRTTGLFMSLGELQQTVASLESAMLIEGPTLQAFIESFRESGRRLPAFAGRSYAATRRALEAQLDQFFMTENGAGKPRPNGQSAAGFRGVFSPHIDFGRGGLVYGFAYRELVERAEADVFVILGVAHKACQRRYVLTRKDFETPLGLARCDRGYVDELIKRVGPRYLDDEIVHRSEHSIEFQVVFLQHALGEGKDFSIVPILAGSFHDILMKGGDPAQDPEVSSFVAALREVEQQSGKRVVYIGGIDLCHVGPEFGDPQPVSAEQQQEIRQFDQALLERAAAGDASGWYGTAAAIGNRHRVCGLDAGFTMLEVLGRPRGQVLRYDQAVDPRRLCCVSFASMAFHDQNAPLVAR